MKSLKTVAWYVIKHMAVTKFGAWAKLTLQRGLDKVAVMMAFCANKKRRIDESDPFS